jgi:transcriptional regulator with XRE-family HTH domain
MSTEQQQGPLIPKWTLGDRLRKARALTGLSAAEFAERIGVSERTVNNAETGAHGVCAITIKQWALVSGVSEAWLEHGEAGGGTPPPGGGQPPAVDILVTLTAA